MSIIRSVLWANEELELPAKGGKFARYGVEKYREGKGGGRTALRTF